MINSEDGNNRGSALVVGDSANMNFGSVLTGDHGGLMLICVSGLGSLVTDVGINS